MTIAFRIPAGDPGHDEANGVFTFQPSSPLPAVEHPVVIDGHTQPGSSAESFLPNIQLDGWLAAGGVDGLKIIVGRSEVRGLIIGGFPGDGLVLDGGAGNQVHGNYLGMEADGRSSHANSNGLLIRDSAGNTIRENLISGNRGAGIFIAGSGSIGNILRDNRLGTDLDGDCHRDRRERFDDVAKMTIIAIGECTRENSIGNGVGVLVVDAGRNVIGRGNVISGNRATGVSIRGRGATGNVVKANRIGTVIRGNQAAGDGGSGVEILDAPSNVQGGPSPDDGNLVSGNQGSGVVIHGSGARDNAVRANLIGTDQWGWSAVPNGGSGVRLDNAPGNVIGGLRGKSGNVISGNREGGIYVTGVGARDNRVLGNLIGLAGDEDGRPAANAVGVVIENGASENTIGAIGREDQPWAGVRSEVR